MRVCCYVVCTNFHRFGVYVSKCNNIHFGIVPGNAVLHSVVSVDSKGCGIASSLDQHTTILTRIPTQNRSTHQKCVFVPAPTHTHTQTHFLPGASVLNGTRDHELHCCSVVLIYCVHSTQYTLPMWNGVWMLSNEI